MMNTKRVMSRQSNVYHREYCGHIDKIKSQNQVVTTWDAAKYRGYRGCKCCNNMSYLARIAEGTMRYNERERGMAFKMKDGMLYVKTEMGCWRLVYTRSTERIALYHRNQRQQPLDWAHPEQSRYHQQKDQLYFRDIKAALDYIYDHDKFRAAEQKDKNNVKFKNKKYQKQAEKRAQRAKLRKVDRIFKELEKKDKGLVKYSMC